MNRNLRSPGSLQTVQQPLGSPSLGLLLPLVPEVDRVMHNPPDPVQEEDQQPIH